MGEPGLTVTKAASIRFGFIRTASVTIKEETLLLMAGQVKKEEKGEMGGDRWQLKARSSY